MDLAASGLMLLLLLPVCMFVGIAILLEDGRPVVYLQRRSGLGGKPFSLIKFRSMRKHDISPDEMGQVTSEHQLVTRVGRIIRRLKLDEVPQLINVLRGEMSLVGPRPTLLSQACAYDKFQRQRLKVLPGMTGWAQVNGNVKLSWDERIAMDVWYVNRCSFVVDLSILWRTVSVVLRGERRNERLLKQAMSHAGYRNRSST